MQAITVEHENTITNDSKQRVVSNKETVVENMREERGVALSTSRKLYHIENSDTYYFQSETQ